MKQPDVSKLNEASTPPDERLIPNDAPATGIVMRVRSAAGRGRLVNLKQSCPPSFHYGATALRLHFSPAAQVAGFARFRLVNPPPVADGLSTPSSLVRLHFITARLPPVRSALYVRAAPPACPAVKKSGRGSCRIFEGWWALKNFLIITFMQFEISKGKKSS